MLASHVPDECIFFFASFLRCSTYLSAACRRFHLLLAWQYIHIDDSALQRCYFMLPGMDNRFPSCVHPLNLLLLRVLEDHIIPHVHRTKTIIILEPLLPPHTTNIDQQALGYSLGRLLCLAVGVHTYIQKLRENVSIAAGISVFESGVERLCNNGSIRHLYLDLGGGLNVQQCHNMFRSLFAGCKTIEQLQIYIPELITVRSFDAETLPWDCFGVLGMLHIGIERIGRHSTALSKITFLEGVCNVPNVRDFNLDLHLDNCELRHNWGLLHLHTRRAEVFPRHLFRFVDTMVDLFFADTMSSIGVEELCARSRRVTWSFVTIGLYGLRAMGPCLAGVCHPLVVADLDADVFFSTDDRAVYITR